MHWLRRAFAGAATAWPMALLLATVAAARPQPSSVGYGFALVVYAAGSLICHQRPERSFHLLGVQLPVCARCMGIYVGAAMTVCLVSMCTAKEVTKKPAVVQAFPPSLRFGEARRSAKRGGGRPAVSGRPKGPASARELIWRATARLAEALRRRLHYIRAGFFAGCKAVRAQADTVVAQGFSLAPRTVLLVSALPTAATLLFEWTTGHTPGNWTRAVSGVPLGAAVGWIVSGLR